MMARLLYWPASSRGGGTGRRARLKIWWERSRVGSIPTLGTNKSRGYSDVALLIFVPVFLLCQICATVIHNTRLGELLGVLREVFGREMRVTPDHLRHLEDATTTQRNQHILAWMSSHGGWGIRSPTDS